MRPNHPLKESKSQMTSNTESENGRYVPLVSIIVPLYNGRMYIRQLLKSIYESDYENLEVIVVDDASTDKGSEIVTSGFHRTRLIRNPTNRGKSWSLNRGIVAASGDFLVMTDQDLTFDKALLSKWVNALTKNPRVGICGCYVYYNSSPTLLFTSGSKFDRRRGLPRMPRTNIELDYSNEHYEESDDWVFDNLYIVRRSVLDSVGLFDYRNFPTVYEEADLQLRAAEAGYMKSIVPGARAYHEVPRGRLAQLRRFTNYKAEMLCRNRLILVRKLELDALPTMFALSLRSIVFYSFVAAIQRTPLRERTALFKSVVRGVSRGLLDPVFTNSHPSGQAAIMKHMERDSVLLSNIQDSNGLHQDNLS